MGFIARLLVTRSERLERKAAPVVELSPWSRKWQHASCADICRKRNKADVFLGCSTAIKYGFTIAVLPRSAPCRKTRVLRVRRGATSTLGKPTYGLRRSDILGKPTVVASTWYPLAALRSPLPAPVPLTGEPGVAICALIVSAPVRLMAAGKRPYR